MTYVIDGYNLIYAVKRFEETLDNGLEFARNTLLEYCTALTLERGDVKKIIIIFDGAGNMVYSHQKYSKNVSTIFTSEDEQADDRIVKFVDECQNKNELCVVSNDNVVCNNIKVRGINVIDAQKFMQIRRKVSVENHGAKEDKNIEDELADKITDEYKKYLNLDE